MWTSVFLLLFSVYFSTEGAGDVDVEQVKSPFVEKYDVGQSMAINPEMQPNSLGSLVHKRSYNPGQYINHEYGTRCISCGKLGGSASASAAASASASSGYSTNTRPSTGNYQNRQYDSYYYSQPQTFSNRKEVSQKQEFVNGQQVYNFHEEKRYKDGELIQSEISKMGSEGTHANNLDNYSRGRQFPNSAVSSSSSSSTYENMSPVKFIPNTMQSRRVQSKQTTMNKDTSHFGTHYFPGESDFHNNFQAEIDRMHEEMRRNTLSGNGYSPGMKPIPGSSHRSEVHYETKYVNGKPVYIKNEEKIYKNGKLVHNVVDEKGPEDLGTSDVSRTHKIPVTLPHNFYSSHQEEIKRKWHTPKQSPDRYPHYSYQPELRTKYTPSSYSSFSSYSSNQKSLPYNIPIESSSATGSSSNAYEIPYYEPSHSTRISETQKKSKSSSYLPSTYNNNIKGAIVNHENSPYASYPQSMYQPTEPRYGETYHKPSYDRSTSYRGLSSSSGSQAPIDGSEYMQTHSHTSQLSSGSHQNRVDQVGGLHTKHRKTNSNYYDHINHEGYQPKVYSTSSRMHQERTYSHNSRTTPPSTQRTHPTSDEDIYSGVGTLPQTLPLKGRTPSKIGIPDLIIRPGTSAKDHLEEEEEDDRYDISPYDDDSNPDVVDKGDNTQYMSTTPYPGTIPSREDSYFKAYEHSRTDHNRHYDYPSQSRYSSPYGYATMNHSSTEHRQMTDNPESRYFGPLPYSTNSKQSRTVGSSNYDGSLNYDGHSPHYGYRKYNSSFFEHRKSVVYPTKWVETKTTYKYRNGILIGEVQYHKYYENDILIHQNTTERSRQDMINEGVDVLNLDLTPSQLAMYGPPIGSTIHSQRQEVHQVKKFRNGQPIYELNEEKLYRDGSLIHENYTELNEHDLKTYNTGYGQKPASAFQRANQHAYSSSSGVKHIGLLNSGSSLAVPQNSVKRHEMHQEEEYINGRKIYELHHERKYKDGRLIYQNKTELGPEDFGVHEHQQGTYRSYPVARNSINTLGASVLNNQRATSNNLLRTTCVNCGLSSAGQGFSLLNRTQEYHGRTVNTGVTLIPGNNLYGRGGRNGKSGSAYRHDIDVEEYYENGKLVKGREESRKWKDGQLLDSKSETYYDGPPRTSKYNLGSTISNSLALLSRPVKIHSRERDDTCLINNCQNGATCKRRITGGQICMCKFGFNGAQCGNAYCPKRFCRYGGTCAIEGGRHVCSCQEGFTGFRCSTKIHRIRVAASG